MVHQLMVPREGRRASSWDNVVVPASSPSSLEVPSLLLGGGSASDDEGSGGRWSIKSRYGRRRSSVAVVESLPRVCIHCLYMEECARSSEGEDGDQEDEGEEMNTDDSLSDWSDNDSCEVEEASSISPPEGDEIITLKVPQISCIDRHRHSDSGISLQSDSVLRNSPPSSHLLKVHSAGGASSASKSPSPCSTPGQRRVSFDVAAFLNDVAARVKSKLSIGGNSTEETASKKRSQSVDVSLLSDDGNYSLLRRASGELSQEDEDERAISRSTARSALNASAALAWRSRNRDVQSKVDWSERATPGDHIWVDHLASGDFCYVTDNECFKMGPKKRCTACHMVAHTACIGLLEQMNFKCKPTFREAGLRNYRDSAPMRHHWVHRRKQEGKCRQCAKSFTSRFGLSRGEIVAISCSWCKQAYHNKVSCFSKQQIEEPCSLGLHAGIVVPPNWIIRSRPSTLKSSIRHHGSTRRRPSRRKKTKPTSTPSIPFLLKPIPAPHLRPLLVFINPRSGGQLGAKLLHKFHWLLNPRQVFDLTDGGPHFGLELYRKVPNLRVLACGGDGTVGWVLSAIDQLRITPPPPVAILPLGTGNDLARTLNWGGGYTDEPLSKVLCQVEEAQAVLLDRWQLTITPNPQATNAEQEPPNATPAMDRLPLDVFNNYFSVGADAAVALEFHESREANPEKFNNRLRNKMFYAGAGGRDLLKRSWRDLSDFVKLECDGKDVTQRLHELKIHCLLFLNIPRYAGGTVPWVSPTGFDAQRHDDGRLEVIGFSTASLAALQFGGSGSSICQCREVVLRTLKTIPAQVDGEPCRLKPTVVRIQIRSQSAMLAKLKRRAQLPINELAPSNVRVQVRAVSITAYESLYNDKDKLRTCANSVGAVSVENAATLDQVRRAIDRLMEDDDSQRGSDSDMRNTNWVFLDHVTADRFFRVDRAQEHLHYVTDISSEELFILNPELDRSPRPSVHEHPSDTPALDSDATLLPRSSSPRNECPPGAPCSPTSELMVVSGGRKEASEEARKRGIAPELFERARNGDLEQIVSLTENGATLHCRDESGQTLMHVAARRGHAHIVRWLIDNAPKELLFTKDFVRGQTALHCAAQSHRKSVCVLLLDAGAEITTADHQGRTPRNLAQSTEDVEVASYLEMQERISGEDQETAV